MLRHDFENHILWTRLEAVQGFVAQIRDDIDPSEVGALEVVETLEKYLWSFHAQRARNSYYFATQMLDAVDAHWQNCESLLRTRAQNGVGYAAQTDQARLHAENGLVAMAPWPRLFAAPKQAEQEQTIFEDLLEIQRKSADALVQWSTTFQSDVEATATTVAQEITQYRTEASAIATTVEAQKTRVDDVVQAGLDAVPKLTSANDEAYAKWEEKATKKLDDATDSALRSMAKKLNDAKKTLEDLQRTVKAYENLSSQDAADILSKHYGEEAERSRKSGLLMYGAGVALLIVGAVPLVLAVIYPPSSNPETYWQSVIVRLSIGAVAVTAATVLIRLGGRFYRDATAAKRMELEMKTIGPFLANVTDRESVDAIHIEIVDRAFGKSYIIAEPAKDDEQVNVSAFSSILSAVSKVVSR